MNVRDILFFDNGNVAVCNEHGEQMPDLQVPPWRVFLADLRRRGLLPDEAEVRRDRGTSGTIKVGDLVASGDIPDAPGKPDAPDKPDHRRRLPDTRPSITHKFVIAGHDFYLTVGLYEGGSPGELFLKAAKEGSTLAGLFDTIGVLISLSLQYGVPVRALVEKLTGARFDPAGITETPGIRFAKSPVDYIMRWMALRFLPPEDRPAAPPPPLVSEAPPPPESKPTPQASGLKGVVVGCDGPPCDRCGNIMQKMGSGDCWLCANCGATSGSCGG